MTGPGSVDGAGTTGRPVDGWACRWCRSRRGVVVLDLGNQSAADFFPALDDAGPDPVYPLRMVHCSECQLAQLESDPTSAEEPRGVEPRALREQADAAIAACLSAGQIRHGDSVEEFPSPHGGSWLPTLHTNGLRSATAARADVVIDCFGMMHSADQHSALAARVARMAPGGLLLLQFHSLAAIMRNMTWSALRHGHFAYYSAPALVRMAATFGLVAVAGWEFALYGGTVLLAFRAAGQQSTWVTGLIERELDAGVFDAGQLNRLQGDMQASVVELRTYLSELATEGAVVAGYGAASRAVALLQLALPDRSLMSVIADASSDKQGRALPGLRIPIVAPGRLAEHPPNRVVLMVTDLLDEVRLALPQVEAAGGRWVILEPGPREVAPLGGMRPPAADSGLVPTHSGAADR